MHRMLPKDGFKPDPEFSGEKVEELLVIGAGLPRTGTLSLMTALKELYKEKCYHMVEAMKGNEEDLEIWMRAMKGEVTDQEWKQFFSQRGCVAGVDFPLSLFFQELMKAFPNAKVVLSVRDPKTWYKSVHETIWQIMSRMKTPTYGLLFSMIDQRKSFKDFFLGINTYKPPGVTMTMTQAIEGGQEMAEKYFNEWTENVKKVVPPERLLVFSAKEGWDPLCKFLEMPVPATPYPRVNDTASMKQGLRNMQIVHGLVFYLFPALAGSLAYYFYTN